MRKLFILFFLFCCFSLKAQYPDFMPEFKVLNTAADIQLHNAINGATVLLRGIDTINDTKGGFFQFNSVSVDAPDGLSVFAVTGVPVGRWLRVNIYPGTNGTAIDTIFSFHTDSIVVNKKLRIPLTDTTHAKKGCGNLIYDTILEHYFGDVCTNGVHHYWGCLDCGYNTVNQINDSSFSICRIDGTCDTIVITASFSGVSSWSGGTTGMTPNVATSGAVTMAGVLVEANGGTHQSSYIKGDIIYASAANTLSKLPIGTAKQTLHVVGGVPSWQDTAAVGGTGTVTSVAATAASGMTVTGSPVTTSGTLAFAWTGAVQGDLPYFSGTNTLSFLNKDATAGYVLKNTGTSNNPAWGPPFTLTTTGSSGVATYSAGTLNIPNYAGLAVGNNGNIQYDSSGFFGANDNFNWDPAWHSLTLRNPNIAAQQQNVANLKSITGLRLKDTVAAANNAQKFTPQLTLTGNGFASTGSRSQQGNMTIQGRTVQGTTIIGQAFDFYFGWGTDTVNTVQGMTLSNSTGSTANSVLTLPGSLAVTSDATIDNGGVSTNNIYHLSGSTIAMGSNYSIFRVTDVSTANTNNTDGVTIQRAGTLTQHNLFEIDRTAGIFTSGLTSTITNGGTTFTLTNATEFLKPNDAVTINSNSYTITAISGTTVTFTPSFSSTTGSYAIVLPAANTNNFGVSDNGIVRIGQGSWTTFGGAVNLPAGNAYLAPLYIKTGGALKTTPTANSIETDDSDLYFSAAAARYKLDKSLSGSATLDFANTNAQTSTDLTISVAGVSDGDVVALGVPNGSVNANTCFTAWVSATGTVTVRFNNYSSGAVDPASGTFKVRVIR